MGTYRKYMLFIKGLLYDSIGGYESAEKHFGKDDLAVDCSGLAYLITGANSGIGFVTAREIARRGGEVHLVCRSAENGEAAVDRIKEESGNNNVHCHVLDMSRINDVHQFVNRFVSETKRLDILINNAGEMIPQLQFTETEGLECNFATNVVGPYTLTSGLIPLLKASSNKPRVVFVGSAGMHLQRLDLKFFSEFENKFDGIIAYAQCKRQLAVLTECWADEHREIHFSCMHPGWVDTPAARRGLGEFYEKMKHKFRNPDQGADTIVWLSVSNSALSCPSGLYFQDRKAVDRHLPLARTRETKGERLEFMRLIAIAADKPSAG